jgi:hypothetical protein
VFDRASRTRDASRRFLKFRTLLVDNRIFIVHLITRSCVADPPADPARRSDNPKRQRPGAVPRWRFGVLGADPGPLWSGVTVADTWKSRRKVTAVVTHTGLNDKKHRKCGGSCTYSKAGGGGSFQKCEILGEIACHCGQHPPKWCRNGTERCASRRRQNEICAKTARTDRNVTVAGHCSSAGFNPSTAGPWMTFPSHPRPRRDRAGCRRPTSRHHP